MSQPDPKKRRIDAGSTIRSLHPELKAPGSSLSQPNYPAELRVPSPSSSSSIAPPPFFQQPSAPVYRSEGRLLGRGTFGAVYHASVAGPVPHHVAIKAVKHRDGDGNVEMAILRELRGSPNIVALLGCFVTGSGEEKRLNLVLEYLSDNLLRIIRHCRQLGRWLNVIDVSLYMHQLLRGLGVLQREAIVHRDLKPANLLVDSSTKILKICDFGTAKQLEPKREDGRGSDNRPYICSRYYRAPELILSAPHYGTAVDLWSAGCILAELLINQPLFTGEDGVSQLVAIMEILGTPSRHELYAMNPHYDESSTFRDSHHSAIVNHICVCVNEADALVRAEYLQPSI
mmetsp:Transcript_23656/g.50494  ORF Transcript_23656/g.50494 Transcript_23656/m.50494 type:complete len:343 (+) Transcript_23656:102-1130(+)